MKNLLWLMLFVSTASAGPINFVITFNDSSQGNLTAAGTFVYDTDSQLFTSFSVQYDGFSLDLMQFPVGWGTGSANHPWIQDQIQAWAPGSGMELMAQDLPETTAYVWNVGYQYETFGPLYSGPVSWFTIGAGRFSGETDTIIGVIDGYVPDAGGSWSIVDPPGPETVPEPGNILLVILGGLLLAARWPWRATRQTGITMIGRQVPQH